MNPLNNIDLNQSFNASQPDISQSTLKLESLYEKKPLCDIHLQQSIHVSKVEISKATIKPATPVTPVSLIPLRDVGPLADNDTDTDVRAAAAMCQYAYHFLNQTKTRKPLAKLIDGWQPMTDSEVDKLVSPGFSQKLQDNYLSGFSSMLFQKTAYGFQYYAYCTEGTEMTSLLDWSNNLSQSLFHGLSRQYSLSVDRAKKIDAAVGNNAVLWFIGHSLGGGLASNNSLATGRHAITFNAAGLNPERISYTLLWNNFSDFFHPQRTTERVHAFVIEGEILNSAAWWIGQSAFGTTKTIKVDNNIGAIDKHGLTTFLDHWGMQYK